MSRSVGKIGSRAAGLAVKPETALHPKSFAARVVRAINGYALCSVASGDCLSKAQMNYKLAGADFLQAS